MVRFSKCTKFEFFDNANGPKLIRFLDKYIVNQENARSKRLDTAR